jgi:outer membrane lipoprotein carrier protein
MKKATLLFITFLFASSLSVWAQTNTATKDPKKILQSVSQKISDLKSLKANFALHLMAANGKTTQSQKGSFQMKGTKYRVTLADQEIICDNKVVWTFLKSINEVQISAYNPSEQTISPAKLFTDFYDKEYNSRYAGSRTVNGKKCDIIELIPKQQQVPTRSWEVMCMKRMEITTDMKLAISLPMQLLLRRPSLLMPINILE